MTPAISIGILANDFAILGCSVNSLFVNSFVVNKNLFTTKLFTNRAVKKVSGKKNTNICKSKLLIHFRGGSLTVIFLGGRVFCTAAGTPQAWLSGWVYSERLSSWLFYLNVAVTAYIGKA